LFKEGITRIRILLDMALFLFILTLCLTPAVSQAVDNKTDALVSSPVRSTSSPQVGTEAREIAAQAVTTTVSERSTLDVATTSTQAVRLENATADQAVSIAAEKPLTGSTTSEPLESSSMEKTAAAEVPFAASTTEAKESSSADTALVEIIADADNEIQILTDADDKAVFNVTEPPPAVSTAERVSTAAEVEPNETEKHAALEIITDAEDEVTVSGTSLRGSSTTEAARASSVQSSSIPAIAESNEKGADNEEEEMSNQTNKATRNDTQVEKQGSEVAEKAAVRATSLRGTSGMSEHVGLIMLSPLLLLAFSGAACVVVRGYTASRAALEFYELPYMELMPVPE